MVTKKIDNVKTLEGLQHLPEEMKKLFRDDDALFNILTDRGKLDSIKKSIEESKATWNSDNVFHVTELLSCMTQKYFLRNPPDGYTEEDMKPSLETLYYFFRGNIFDLIFSMAMPHSQVGFNIPVGDNVTITGRTDWLDVEDDKIVAVSDLKTVRNLWYIKKEGAKSDHYKQIMVYAWVFGCDVVKIYYLDFGELIVKEFNVKDNKKDQEEIVDELKRKALLLYEHIQNKEPIWPPQIDWKDPEEGYRCKPSFCPFTMHCHPDFSQYKQNKIFKDAKQAKQQRGNGNGWKTGKGKRNVQTKWSK